MANRILIIGEDPSCIDFSAPGAPPGITAGIITDGLNGSRDRLRAHGHVCDILWTRDADSIEAMTCKALDQTKPELIVIGAGLRAMSAFAEHFELLMNTLHRHAPDARFAFNSRPGDSDEAALRQLTLAGHG